MKNTILNKLFGFRFIPALKLRHNPAMIIQIAFATTIMMFSPLCLFAQSDIVLNNRVLGSADVTATNSISLSPGFHAVSGSRFHAWIGTGTGEQYSDFTVPETEAEFPKTSMATATNLNYIRTITYREPLTSEPTSDFKFLESIAYYDGLGRPVQSVEVGASPQGNDIIQPVFYDEFGRELYKAMPYIDERSGSYRSDLSLSVINDFYNSGDILGLEQDNRAYTEIVYDNSPLNRMVSQIGPGNDWTGKASYVNYLTNNSSMPVVTGWNVSNTGSFSSFNYSYNSLYVNESIDEQGNTVREFKDKDGRVVQKASKKGASWLRTAYIYDDFGLLRCVVPPKATGPEDIDLCYYYNYDERHRMTEKKLPGAGTVTMIYDKRDRLRCTQNSEQAEHNLWSFVKYDVLNRVVVTGTFINTTGASVIKTAIDAAALNESRNNAVTAFGYTSASYPATGATITTATYYDDYEFIDGMTLGDSLDAIETPKFDVGEFDLSAKIDIEPTGQVTGTMTRISSDDNDAGVIPVNILYSATYYDKYGHILRSIAENHLGGKDVITNNYEPITWLVSKTKQEHYKGGSVDSLIKTFEYDHTGRLLATRLKVNNQSEITENAMAYNELGQMITKYLHSDETSGERTFIQKEDLSYNIRGWLTAINEPDLSSDNDLFGMQLLYTSTAGLGALDNSTGYYNGNIAGMKWQVKDDVMRGFVFDYDSLNRLTTSGYAQGNSLNSSVNYYSESVTGYDNNGNIMGLQRKYDNNLVDNLSYVYFGSSNQIQSITDNGVFSAEVNDFPGSSSSYEYDENGNMTFDGSRNTTLTYHSTLNLPLSVDFGSNNRIFYHYTEGGAKLLKHVVEGSGTEMMTHYIGNIVYENNELSYILSDEGRLVSAGTGEEQYYAYEYHLKDHLGNTRVIFMGTDLGGAVDVVQTTNYYPFGLVMTQANNNSDPDYSKNKYLYNGKELQDDQLNGTFFGLLDYGARFYDPQLGRWHSIDPLAEKGRRWSPYTYGADNPMRFIDPDGMSIKEFFGNLFGALFGGGGGGGKGIPFFNTFTAGKGDGEPPASGKSNYVEKVSETEQAKQTWDVTFPPSSNQEPQAGSQNYVEMPSQSQSGSEGNENDIPSGGGGGVLNGIQTGLDVLGLIPGVGEFFDGANALIYTARGDYVNAGLSAAACIPFAGWAATGGKLANKAYTVYQGVDKATGAVKYVGITSREVTQRAAEHAAKGDAWKALDFQAVPGALNLDRTGARIMEQNLINQYGLPNLYNQINSISPKYWSIYGIK